MKDSLVEQVKDTFIRCPKCGSLDIRGPGRRVSSSHKNWCVHCGYSGRMFLETRDTNKLECKLNDEEQNKDQGTLKDLLMEKK